MRTRKAHTAKKDFRTSRGETERYRRKTNAPSSEEGPHLGVGL